MLESEGSLEVLNNVLDDARTPPHVRDLVHKILELYEADSRGELIEADAAS